MIKIFKVLKQQTLFKLNQLFHQIKIYLLVRQVKISFNQELKVKKDSSNHQSLPIKRHCSLILTKSLQFIRAECLIKSKKTLNDQNQNL